MRFEDYLRAARTNLVVLIVLTVVGCIVGLLATLGQTPQYKSTVSVIVTTQQATNLNDLTQGAIFTEQAVKNYANAIDTPLVLQPALNALGMTRSARALADQVVVVNPLDTTILDISVTDPSPVDAARIANAIQASLSKAVNTLTPPTADSVAPIQIILLESAVASTVPTSPNTPLIVAIGGLIGLALAVFIALFRSALERRARADQTGRDASGPATDRLLPARRRASGAPAPVSARGRARPAAQELPE